jgi:hypothetical protein
MNSRWYMAAILAAGMACCGGCELGGGEDTTEITVEGDAVIVQGEDNQTEVETQDGDTDTAAED